MPAKACDMNAIRECITGKLLRYYGVTVESATKRQIYKATAITIRDQIMQMWMESKKKNEAEQGKTLYYLSIEFLMGRSMNQNLINMCAQEHYTAALRDLGVDILDLMEEEPEPALGNGGLGRLAAGFLDSLSTLGIPSVGSTIRYEYGLFRQRIVDGQQVELPDPWLQDGNVWEIPVTEDICQVQFGGEVKEYQAGGRWRFALENAYTIDAVPYDMPVVGYGSAAVNTLRTWSARSRESFDLHTFGRGEYDKAMDEMRMAEVINKVLYPEDSHWEGKMLRMKQQYFFTSATVQTAVRKFKKRYGTDFGRMPEKVVFHINDTHPGLAIPELMRILIDNEGLGWDSAQGIVNRCFAYTNHTVMQEALERWPQEMMKQTLPRIYMILEEMNRRLCEDLFRAYPDQWDRIGSMAILSYGQVQMANLCVSQSYSVNAVSQLHGKILTDGLFHDYWLLNHDKFTAITNGITHRRWLLSANPKLTELLEEAIGPGFRGDAQELEKLKPFAGDAAFRDKYAAVKRQNKERLSALIKHRQNDTVSPDFIFDVQAKRLHEYKRQLLNALHIQVLYNRIADDPNYSMPPRAFLFGAKAAPGYHRAKLIIRYINALKTLIESHPRASEMLKVVYIENYDVSTAEIIMPAAEISQQLSTAGKEASGTGNMKFMMNGAITLGTMDGANVEIFELVGDENIYIFGMRADTVENMYKSGAYNPMSIFESNAEIKKAMGQLIDGTLFPREPLALQELYHTLLVGDHGGMADSYFVLKDFGSYSMANRRMMDDYQNRDKWLKMAVMNTAMSGHFSSDRTIKEYNERIWRM
ncbi:MAG: glycogen/starch/alpha-glucan phosphorylase [Clostridiales bacterium]|nr:glycogen/starch/alpha-glucan phosphorylase [Clostridiales bacterium]